MHAVHVVRRLSRWSTPWPQAAFANPFSRYLALIEPRWLARGAAAFGSGFALGLVSATFGLLP